MKMGAFVLVGHVLAVHDAPQHLGLAQLPRGDQSTARLQDKFNINSQARARKTPMPRHLVLRHCNVRDPRFPSIRQAREMLPCTGYACAPRPPPRAPLRGMGGVWCEGWVWCGVRDGWGVALVGLFCISLRYSQFCELAPPRCAEAY